jgi:hypothetical protein
MDDQWPNLVKDRNAELRRRSCRRLFLELKALIMVWRDQLWPSRQSRASRVDPGFFDQF